MACRKKKSDNKCVKITLPEELYFALKSSAKNELRSVSQQIRFFIELGIEAFNAQVQQAQGEEEELPEAIGFKMEPEGEDEDPEEEDVVKPKKKK
ncbi:MAG: hypothetical protein WC511_02105 [Candidatus Pacearchaeota archaeon]